MNEYRITYTLDGEEHHANITERTEKAARKRFQGVCKSADITDTELIDTDAPATKEQERETLEKIKAMVAELGSGSYLETAFAGVFEDAEANIENDFAFSMKARVESVEAKLREMSSDYIAAKRDASALEEELGKAREQITALTRRQLPEELRRDLWMMTTDEAEASRARMAKAAHMMAVCADNPACVGFQESVADYRKEEKRAEAMEKLAAALDAIEPERKEGGAA